jgi:prophage regulatory protein
MDRICREKEVLATVGVSRTTLWRWEQYGIFPRRLKIGLSIIGWRESDVQGWMSSRLQVSRTENSKGELQDPQGQ